MAMDVDIVGGTSGTKAEVAGTNQLKIIPETNATTSAANIGGIRIYSENDQGLAAGLGTVTPYLQSPETSDEYRLRTELDTILDEESFVYTAQNFTKHSMAATTYVPAWANTGFQTNPTNLLTAAAAVSLRTYKTFSIVGTETLSLDMEAAFTYASGTQLPTNTVIEFGLGLCATATPYDFFDGAYMRLTPSGAYLVIRNNSGTDTAVSNLLVAPDSTGTTVWQPVSGRKYQFIVYLMTRSVELWISDPVTGLTWLAGDLNTPAGYGQPVASPAVQFVCRQYQATAPTVASQITIGRYSVRRGGQQIASGLGEFETRAAESILAAGTLTTTGNQTVTTGSIVATAGTPSNAGTGLALNSLSGIVQETATYAVATDVILMAYQNPALPTATGTSYAQSRRLRIDGLHIASSCFTAFTAGGFAKSFYLAYGSTSLSLAGVTADTVTTKAYRRVQLAIMQAWLATQAAGTIPTGDASKYIQFKNPIYVNPGEFIALTTRHTGTAGTAGVIQHSIAFDYSWE